MRTFASLLLLGACIHFPPPTELFRESGLQRAEFELECPASQLELRDLAPALGFGCDTAQVGVRGCGRQAVYACGRDQQWHAERGASSALGAGDRGPSSL